jgi:glycosyltransferase involved in cell wall biosynthesis
MSNLPPIVSVIMPCFNQGQFIEEAVESVFAQTFASVEIIIVNDGSTDTDTVRLLNQYKKPNVSVIHTENRGPSAARNTGIHAAKGTYILPLDADDRIAPTYLEKAVPILDSQPNVGIVYSQAELFGDKTGAFDLPDYQFPNILLGNMIFNSSLYRRSDWEKIGGYNENMVWGWEDYDFWLSIIELGRTVFRIPEVLYFHREVANSRSQQMTQDCWLKSYTQLFKNHPQLYANHIDVIFEQILELRKDLHQTHYQVHLTQLKLNTTQLKLESTQHRLNSIVATVLNSKFWQVRNRWFSLKERFGLATDRSDPLLLSREGDRPKVSLSMRVKEAVSSLGRKLGKLYQAWRERGTRGFFQFLYDRTVARFRKRSTYQQWVKQHQLTPADLKTADLEMAQWQHRPTFSVILPVYNVDAVWLTKAIESVRHQIYPDWELCIADDASTAPHIQPLLTHYSKLDSRIKVVFRAENGNIVATSNAALELATGDYLALLDHDDELAIDALFENAKLINQHPDADFIYSDEDKMTPVGDRHDPFFKPDWSPDYFHSCMYTCHLGVYRTSLVRAIGGFRAGYDGSQDYDLVLRLVEHTQQIYHIPKILYHWRVIPASVASSSDAKPWAYEAAKRALEDMLTRSEYAGRVEPGPREGFYRIRREIQGTPLVSIVIPSAGKTLTVDENSRCLVEACIRSIRDRSSYRHFELIVVDGYDIPDPIIQAIAGDDLKLVRSAEPFNFAQRINLGVAQAQGEFVLLLNDDVEILTPDWLESMLEFAQQPDIGAVGAKLFFPDGTLQHVGVMVLGGNPGHAFHGVSGDHPGYFLSNLVNRNYLGVTAACLMMRRSLYNRLGGMDETFPLNYNDVDLCLKAHQAGYRQVVTPYAQLTHYESASRQAGLQPKEWENLNKKWKSYFDQLNYGDPYYNPNLSRNEVLFEL